MEYFASIKYYGNKIHSNQEPALLIKKKVNDFPKIAEMTINSHQMASFSAANSIKVEMRKGEISVGKDADFVVLDRELNLRTTFVNGEIVYNAIN